MYRMEVVNVLNDEKTFAALSSRSRLRILQLLSRKPKSIAELAKDLKLKPITIRHHIKILMHNGFVEDMQQNKGTVERPELVYKLTEANIRISFPKRDYLFLASILVEGLQSILGVDETKALLYKIGEQKGRDIITALQDQNNVESWTPKLFNSLFVQNFLDELKVEPNLVTLQDKKIIFRERNCLFLELAKNNPELICDGLDEGFHAGLINGMNVPVEGQKRKCMGHGDSFCEYMIQWK